MRRVFFKATSIFACFPPVSLHTLPALLHPLYPELQVIVHNFMRANPDWRVFCVVDREDIIAAAKYLLCNAANVDRFKEVVRGLFQQYVFSGHAEFFNSNAIILSLDTPLIPYYHAVNSL